MTTTGGVTVATSPDASDDHDATLPAESPAAPPVDPLHP